MAVSGLTRNQQNQQNQQKSMKNQHKSVTSQQNQQKSVIFFIILAHACDFIDFCWFCCPVVDFCWFFIDCCWFCCFCWFPALWGHHQGSSSECHGLGPRTEAWMSHAPSDGPRRKSYLSKVFAGVHCRRKSGNPSSGMKR